MQSQFHTALQQASNDKLQQQIPWWSDLDPEVFTELKLSPIEKETLQFIDIAIVGGGVAGLSAALHARKYGARVVVLEREAMLGYGATGQNAGILTPGINMGMSDLPPESPARSFFPETTAIFHALIAEAAQPHALLSAQLTGAICLAESTNAARKLEREVHTRVAAGLRAELWTASQVVEATGGHLNVASVRRAMWLPDEGRINPLTLLAHLAKQARNREVPIRQAYVLHYEEKVGMAKRHHWHITLSDGPSFSARALILAIGPTVQPNARIFALAFAANLPDSFPLFWDASPYTYADYRPGNGRLSVSGGRYGKAGVTRNDVVFYKRLANATRHWLPELTDKEPIFTWSVDLAVTADMLPELRKFGNRAPGVAIEGLGAHGVLPGIALAGKAVESVMSKLS